MSNITRVQLAQSFSATGAQSYTTAVQNPGWNCLITAAVKIFNSTAANLGTVTLSGNGLTWVEIGHVDFETIAAPTSRLYIFRALAPASGPKPTPGAVTITVSGTTNTDCHWDFQEWHGIDLSGTSGSGAIGKTGSNSSDSATSITVTLASVAGNGAVYLAYGVGDSAQTDSPGVGYSALADLKDGTPNFESLFTEWGAPGTTTPSASDSGASAGARTAFAIEIRAAQPTFIQTLW